MPHGMGEIQHLGSDIGEIMRKSLRGPSCSLLLALSGVRWEKAPEIR